MHLVFLLAPDGRPTTFQVGEGDPSTGAVCDDEYVLGFGMASEVDPAGPDAGDEEREHFVALVRTTGRDLVMYRMTEDGSAIDMARPIGMFLWRDFSNAG